MAPWARTGNEMRGGRARPARRPAGPCGSWWLLGRCRPAVAAGAARETSRSRVPKGTGWLRGRSLSRHGCLAKNGPPPARRHGVPSPGMDAAAIHCAADSRRRAFPPVRDLLYPVAMGEVVNLNRVRKAKAKAAAASLAAANRAKHGRTAAGKANDRREEARRQALLDGNHRDDAPQPDAPQPGGPGQPGPA